MTRDVLAFLLCALVLGVGLATAVIQSENRAQALDLDALQRECRMIEAANSARWAEVLELDWAPDAAGAAAAPAGAGAEREERTP